MEVNICHICLDYLNYLPESLIKKCCNAFICNSCWINLCENSNISECPICKRIIIRENQILLTDTSNVVNRTFMDNYGHLFHRLLMLLKWSVIGYSLPTLTLYLAYYYERDKLKERLTDIFFTFYLYYILGSLFLFVFFYILF